MIDSGSYKIVMKKKNSGNEITPSELTSAYFRTSGLNFSK